MKKIRKLAGRTRMEFNAMRLMVTVFPGFMIYYYVLYV